MKKKCAKSKMEKQNTVQRDYDNNVAYENTLWFLFITDCYC